MNVDKSPLDAAVRIATEPPWVVIKFRQFMVLAMYWSTAMLVVASILFIIVGTVVLYRWASTTWTETDVMFFGAMGVVSIVCAIIVLFMTSEYRTNPLRKHDKWIMGKGRKK